MQENREREEDGSLSLSDDFSREIAPVKSPVAIFFGIASRCGAGSSCNFLERFVRIEEDCDRAFIDQFY